MAARHGYLICTFEFAVVATTLLACGSGAARNDAPIGLDGIASVDGNNTVDAANVAPEFHSGSRIRARVVEGNASARMLDGWVDTLLNTGCAWATGKDGVMRCYPETIANEMYADAACTVATAQFASCQPPPPLVTWYDNGDSSAVSVHRIGAQITPVVVYGQGTAGCTEMYRTEFLPGYSFYDAATTLPISELVTASLRAEARGPALIANVITGSDGSLDAHAIFDRQRDMLCNTQAGVSTTDVCRPSYFGFASSTLFLDDTCSTRGASNGPRRQPFIDKPARLLRDSNGNFLQVGAAYTGAVFAKSGATCTMLTSPRSMTGVGSMVALSDLVPFTTATEGADRVQLQVLHATTGERLVGRTFLDHARSDAECFLIDSPEAQQRCYPRSELYGYDMVNFQDASCQQPMLALRRGGQFTGRVAVVLDDISACNHPATVYPVGTQLTGVTTVYRKTNSQCVVANLDSNVDYYATPGAEPSSSFPLLTRRVE